MYTYLCIYVHIILLTLCKIHYIIKRNFYTIFIFHFHFTPLFINTRGVYIYRNQSYLHIYMCIYIYIYMKKDEYSQFVYCDIPNLNPYIYIYINSIYIY